MTRPKIVSGEEEGGWYVLEEDGEAIDWFKEYADAESCASEHEELAR